MEQDHKIITVERPTGPRLTVSEPKSIGQLVSVRARNVFRPIVSSAVTIAAAVVAVLTKHKIEIGSAAAMAVAVHLFSAVSMMGIIDSSKPTIGGYQGPGDVISGAILFWSCSRAYNAAYAAGTGNMCDFNDATTGTAICTLKAATTGFADLTGTYCAGSVNIVTACAGGCVVSKTYDQTGTGNDGTQATNANRPTVVFAGDPSSTLPVMFNSSATSAVLLATAGNPTITQPALVSGVYIRTSGTVRGAVISNSGSQFCVCAGGANNAILAMSTDTNAGATDAAWHSASAYGNGASGATNVDGSDTGANIGSGSPSGSTVRIFRWGPNNELLGNIAEVIIYSNTTTTSTDRNNLSANQHSATNGYNF